jgi:ribosomal biogenesis protein LAS1
MISIRHRATHEDLPPLSTLRQAIFHAIDYLQHYSFLPLLASSSDDQTWDRREKVDNLLKRWKKVMKVRVKEKIAGEENETGYELRRLRKEMESEDVEDLAEVLCTVGALVPMARRSDELFRSKSQVQADPQTANGPNGRCRSFKMLLSSSGRHC